MIEGLFLMLASVAPQTPADPLAAAKAGKIQCTNPNVEKKTCVSLTRYKVKRDGSFESTGTVLISPQPVTTMEIRSAGTVKDGALCSPIRTADFETATYRTDGKPVDAATAAAIRPQIVGTIAPMANKTGCMREVRDGALLRMEVSIDGVARPEMTQKALWVKPEDGYTVAP
ncbi:hypothetical protein [Sphingomonas sp. LM7]|uniref:hypothetical protein n=1 Tax=Sphingomonas sp. LM7 TaxID=1938607 RepID=UPI000983AD5C|nr:hypothetical protein [Sphingomonas sp. LM7]AQR73245.1 hypothetical protein BXU08_05685 [Sphingomonas sp. LM7]